MQRWGKKTRATKLISCDSHMTSIRLVNMGFFVLLLKRKIIHNNGLHFCIWASLLFMKKKMDFL